VPRGILYGTFLASDGRKNGAGHCIIKLWFGIATKVCPVVTDVLQLVDNGT